MSSFHLICGALVVGNLENCFCVDETWSGDFVSRIDHDSGELAQRVLQFIEFCQGWNERVLQSLPNTASEFDEYRDLTKSGLWRTTSADGDALEIADAPVFFQNGEVSWRVVK